MWEAVQISIAGIFGVMAAIFLLYCTVLLSGYVIKKIEENGRKADE